MGVIPHYQNEFGIDGVMMDMGHALPMALKQRVVQAARDINPDFAFWEENFLIEQQSVDEGYNAVLGYWCSIITWRQAARVSWAVWRMTGCRCRFLPRRRATIRRVLPAVLSRCNMCTYALAFSVASAGNSVCSTAGSN